MTKNDNFLADRIAADIFGQLSSINCGQILIKLQE